MSPTDKQGRVLWSFYVRPEAKRAVEALADSRGESASETLRNLLSLGLQHATKPNRGASTAPPSSALSPEERNTAIGAIKQRPAMSTVGTKRKS